MQDFFNQNSQINLPTTKITLKAALYVVATPIGNLKDITIRALEILQNCDAVICEDSRVTSKILKRYNILDKKLLIYNDHSTDHDRIKILNLLEGKKSVALVSDAGTPLISDPGHKLIEFLRIRNQEIIPIPGPSSVITALSSCGIACDNFLFLGFAPNSKIQMKSFLKAAPVNYTLVFFESPNRLLQTLKTIKEVLGVRKIAVARELTKLYEEITSGKIEDVLSSYSEKAGKIKGEIVIVIEKADRKEKSLTEDELLNEIKRALKAKISIKDLSQQLAETYDLNKKEIYKLALKIV